MRNKGVKGRPALARWARIWCVRPVVGRAAARVYARPPSLRRCARARASILYYTMLYYAMLCYTILYYTVLYCTILYYAIII